LLRRLRRLPLRPCRSKGFGYGTGIAVLPSAAWVCIRPVSLARSAWASVPALQEGRQRRPPHLPAGFVLVAANWRPGRPKHRRPGRTALPAGATLSFANAPPLREASSHRPQLGAAGPVRARRLGSTGRSATGCRLLGESRLSPRPPAGRDSGAG